MNLDERDSGRRCKRGRKRQETEEGVVEERAGKEVGKWTKNTGEVNGNVD